MTPRHGWVTVFGVFSATLALGCGRSEAPAPAPAQPPPAESAAAASPATPAATPDPFSWASAIARVEEVRGSAGRITTPPELQHYDDRRRFLAVQMADSQEESYDLPHDHAELAEMIQRGEVVALPALGEDHILYDVGTDAREDPLAHYDVASGKDIPLFPDQAAYQAEDARLAAAGDKAKRELLASFYGDPSSAETMYREHRAVTELAKNFGGHAYDLTNPDDRTRFQVRLLSMLRPPAKETVLDIARAYHRRFDRLLPVSSLVRTERYQRRLSRVNRNATRVEIPPHATGMAFDISYKFMAPDEQNFIMEHVAKMEAEGRVEALRENRNAIHIYTFKDGQRPAETLVAGFLSDVQDAHPGSARPAARGGRSRNAR
jgi:hypothetical protein